MSWLGHRSKHTKCARMSLKVWFIHCWSCWLLSPLFHGTQRRNSVQRVMLRGANDYVVRHEGLVLLGSKALCCSAPRIALLDTKDCAARCLGLALLSVGRVGVPDQIHDH
ncbi:hypothetical protein U1Q18_031407 [Sarracenia purpurea var. burkii]